MLRKLGLMATTLAIASMVLVAGPGFAKGNGKGAHGGNGNAKAHQHHNHSGRQLLGDKIHKNGVHVIDRVGKNSVSVVVKDGKVQGMKVKNSVKGDVAVKKYKAKTTEKLGQLGGNTARFASYEPTQLAQGEDVTWIGYSFIDDYGDEQIYWFPYDMVYDPDTDAIMYVPADTGGY